MGLFLSLILVLFWSGQGPPELRYERPWKVPQRYAFMYGLGLVDEEKAWRALPFDSISLERKPCFGSCPVYKATFYKGGRATFQGAGNVERKGKFEGRIGIYDYARLCYLLEEMEFSSMRSSYRAAWTDDSTVILTATKLGGVQRHSVEEYGRFGPPRLWALQMAVDLTVERIQWSK